MDPKNSEDGAADPAADEAERKEVEIVPTKPERRDSTAHQLVAIGDEFKKAGSTFRRATEGLRNKMRQIPGIRRLIPTDKK